MARIAGRNGRVYFAVASGAAASPLPFQASWSINFSTNKIDVTAMGDNNKVYVSGLADASGDFAGFYDDVTAQTYTAASDGIARSFYLYPSTTTATTYFFGQILADLSVSSSVDGAVAVSASWSAASQIQKIG